MKVEAIEGVGPAYAAKLGEVGIVSVKQLLEATKAKRGRVDVAERTGISEVLVLRWANHADLMRIKGIGPEYSELLELAGVDTVVELATRNPDNLHQAMVEANAKRKVVRQLPGKSRVASWVTQAKGAERVITH